jgi:hypothetical protein
VCSKLSSKWSKAAVAAKLPADTISQFAHSQHDDDDVSSHQLVRSLSPSASPPPPGQRPTHSAIVSPKTDDDESFRQLDRIYKSTEPREQVLLHLEAFVMDELARSLDACFAASRANVTAEMRALVTITAHSESAAFRNADGAALTVGHPRQLGDSAIASLNEIGAHNGDPQLAAHRAETAFRASYAATVSATAAPMKNVTRQATKKALGRQQKQDRPHFAALKSLVGELWAAREYHRVADICLKVIHAVDVSALQKQMEGTNAAAAAALGRALIYSVLFPTDLIVTLGSPFLRVSTSILPRPNDGVCMDAHLHLPQDVFAPSRIDASKVIVDATRIDEQQFSDLSRLTATEKAQLGIKYARIFSQHAKLVSLHAYCRDHSDRGILADLRSAPAVHTELCAMDAAVMQVERWLRDPSEFSARLAGPEAISQSNGGSDRGEENDSQSRRTTISLSEASTSDGTGPFSSFAPSLLATTNLDAAEQLDVLSLISLKVRFICMRRPRRL